MKSLRDAGDELRKDKDLEREKEQELGEPSGLPLSPSWIKESVIVLDWDDTILPTSWLERIRALTAGVPLRPEVQRQMADLCRVCAHTMSMAQQMGTVIFITNSAPGWVDQSCQLFMPQIHQQVRGYQIFPKPLHAPLTFKLSAFRRECQAYKNLVSVGDGDAERAASLRLLAQPDRKMSGRGGEPERCVKSVKLLEFPSCQQLIAEHEMLQVRLLDIATFRGSLDLKARFPGSIGFGGGPAAQGGKPGACTLVHFPRSIVGSGQGGCQLSSASRPAQSASAAVRPMMQEDSGTAASGKMQQGLMLLSKLPPGLRSPAHGLPPLGGPGSPGGRSGSDTAPSAPMDHGGLSGLVPPRGGAIGDPRFLAGGSAPAEFMCSAEGNAASASGAGSSSEEHWKMQSMTDPRTRPQYQSPGKKRPGALGSPASPLSLRGARGGGGAVWREGSAPAASQRDSSVG